MPALLSQVAMLDERAAELKEELDETVAAGVEGSADWVTQTLALTSERDTLKAELVAARASAERIVLIQWAVKAEQEAEGYERSAALLALSTRSKSRVQRSSHEYKAAALRAFSARLRYAAERAGK